MNSDCGSDLTPGPSASPHSRGANAAHSDHPVMARAPHVCRAFAVQRYPPSASRFPFPERCTSLQQREFNQTANRRYGVQRRAELQRFPRHRARLTSADAETLNGGLNHKTGTVRSSGSHLVLKHILSFRQSLGIKKMLILRQDVDHEMSPL